MLQLTETTMRKSGSAKLLCSCRHHQALDAQISLEDHMLR